MQCKPLYRRWRSLLSSRVTVGALCLFVAAVASASETDLIEAGRNIYRSTIGVSGDAISATVHGDVPMPAPAAACSNCHRRSGYGVSEGGSRALNLTANALFSPSTKPPLRPAYTEQTLIRAIVTGVGADGRELHANMPRYALSSDDAAALIAYLKTLGSANASGLSDTELVIATVLADNAPKDEREAVQQVMHRYVELKNGETRRESARAEVSTRHYYGRSRQRAFRTWNLHEWHLKGSPSGWKKQLAAMHEKDRPFAIVSGAVGDSFAVVHAFCEEHEIPCLLPLSDPPENPDQAFYSLYFSDGAALQARVIAKHIQTSATTADSPVLIIHDGSAKANASLKALLPLIEHHPDSAVRVVKVSSRRTPDARKWQKILGDGRRENRIIALMPETSMDALPEALGMLEAAPRIIYTTESMTDWATASSSTRDKLSSRVRHVYPYTLPSSGGAQFPREYLWFKQHDLESIDPVLSAKVLFACRVLGVGLADIQNNFSGEYLIESLEHALDGTQLTSLLPRTSLGPGQRVLSRGAYLVSLSALPDSPYTNPLWIQP